MRLSRRTGFLEQSEIRNMTLECTRVGGINLSQGVCDTPVPEIVRRAAQAAIDEGYNIYTRCDGLSELRSALARTLKSHNGLDYDPDAELVVTSGATGAFYAACMALLEPGGEAILFEPYYGYHVDTLRALGAVPRYVTLSPPAWSFEAADLERAASARTRLVVVNTPSNPSGKVFTQKELELVRDFAQARDLWVVTDEIYDRFLYDRNRHTSPATLSGMKERTVTIGGLSKTFAITGWRIGFAGAPKELSRTLSYVSDLIYVCAPAPLQLGVARGLDLLGSDFYSALQASYTLKRDKICEALTRAGITPHVPEGAYYVLADTARLPGRTSKERVMYLLEKTGVASVPGSAFYAGDEGENLARFCFAKTERDLDEACRRLERFRV